MLVLESPFGSQAKPKRGAQLFLSGKFTPRGASASPGKTSPDGALGKTVDSACPGMTLNVSPCVSSFGVEYSYRTPSVSTSLLFKRHSSCANPEDVLLRALVRAFGPCWKFSGIPKRKSAKSFPEPMPPAPAKVNIPGPMKSKAVLNWYAVKLPPNFRVWR